MKRLFIAVDFADNEDIIKLHREISSRLQKEKIKWTKPENLHLTLEFLGSTPSAVTGRVGEVLQHCGDMTQPFVLKPAGAGIFGSRYKPRVLWLGFEPCDALQRLVRCIRQGMEPLGFVADRQNFVPHLTLGRITRIESKRYFQSVIDDYRNRTIAPVPVTQIHLYESVLTKAGPEYTTLKTIRLTQNIKP